MRSRFRTRLAITVAAVLAAGFLVADVSSAGANEKQLTPVMGSFAVGGSLTAGVDERTGTFSTQVPVSELPGVDGVGGVGVTVSYSHDAGASGTDLYGLGAGWGWNVSRVLTDGGVRVVTPSGVIYHASKTGESSDPTEIASGLAGYVQGDVVFSQTGGILDDREGERDGVVYSYSLEYTGGVTDYFDAAGFVVARVGVSGIYDRVDWEWSGGRLMRMVDGAGSQLVVGWSDAGVEVTSSPRSDGVSAKTFIETGGNRLVSITDPVGQKATFSYNMSGLMTAVITDSGATTVVAYQSLPNNHLDSNAQAVKEVRVSDSNTGAVLSTRTWSVEGEHNSQGSPVYGSAEEMWAAGDGEYRYKTVLTDDATRLVSEYNSMGVMLARQIIVSTRDGVVPVQEQAFTYEGTEAGGVPQTAGSGAICETKNNTGHLS